MNFFKHITFPTSVVAIAFAAILCVPVSLSAQTPISRKQKHRLAQRRPAKAVVVRKASPARRVLRPVRGNVITVMPRTAVRYRMANANYFLLNGFFYRSGPRGYVVVGAPIGFQVRTLPTGFRRIARGAHVYFYAHGTYYRYHPRQHMYEVIPAPVLASRADTYDEVYEPYGY